MKFILIFLAILPIIILGFYISSKDEEKEPKALLISLFLSGVLSSVLVILISLVIEKIFPILSRNIKTMNYYELAIYSFLGVASVEEGCKWFFTRIIGFRSKCFDQAYDIIVYSTFVSLGFAFVENILYVLQYGAATALFRGITSVPAHVCFGIIMGYYLLLAKLSKKNKNKKLYVKNIFLSIFVPFFIHGIYDYLLFLSNSTLLILFLTLVILFFLFSYNKLQQLSKITIKLSYKNTNCPKCGRIVDSDYCPKCGSKNEYL